MQAAQGGRLFLRNPNRLLERQETAFTASNRDQNFPEKMIRIAVVQF